MVDVSGEGAAGFWIDVVQTAALVVSMMAQIYVMLLMRNEMRAAADAVTRVGRRLDAMESERSSGGSSDVVRDWLGKAWQNIVKIEARLDALERGEPPPPGTRPTDPPLP
jgi:hypothetical protein